MASINAKYIIFIAIYIFILAFSFILYSAIQSFNKYKIVPLDNTLNEYSYDIKMYPFPSTVNLDNQFACTPSDPKTCSTEDSTTCFGCKNLIAKCVHLDQDTQFTDVDGNTGLLPKNTSETEGYCLSLSKLFDNCDPQYGDYVIVTQNATSNDYYLTCSCKYPGIVGTTSYTSNCNEVYVCNGDMNLSEFKCNCSESQKNNTINGIPVCQNLTVADYEYPDNTIEDSLKLKKDAIDNDIGGNTNSQYMINSCKICPLTKNYVNGYLISGSDGARYYCATKATDNGFNGLPYRLNDNSRYLIGTNFADCVLDLFVTAFYDFGFIQYSNETVKNPVSFAEIPSNARNNVILSKILNKPENEITGTYYLKMFDDFNTHKHVLTANNITQGTNMYLQQYWPSYSVHLFQKNHYDSRAVDTDLDYVLQEINGKDLESLGTELFNYLPGSNQAHELGGAFVWGRGKGENVHQYTPLTRVDENGYLLINPDTMSYFDTEDALKTAKIVGIKYTSENNLIRYSCLRSNDYDKYVGIYNKRVK